MFERVDHLRNRLIYPSSQDGKDILLRVVPPSVLLILASSIKQILPIESQAISNLENEGTIDLAKKARVVAIPSFIAAGLIFAALSYREVKNRVQYGEHLTVSKVALHPGYFAVKLFPELAKERFAGELHFKGKWKMRYSPQESPHTVMRKLFSDLYELATAVEREETALSDFQHFMGLSSMITLLFERFGFSVVHYKDQLGLPPLGQEYQSSIKLEMRPVMAAMISKEKLVEYKQDFAHVAHRN